MRVGIFHNRYRQRGGEDTAVDFEVELLRKAGHEVHCLVLDNREGVAGPVGALRTAWHARANPHSERRVAAFLDAHPIDVGHVHNFFPLLSPVVHWTLRRRGIPVVQTLHNYRLLCANGALLRDGMPCEDCVSRGPWNAVRHGCYRGSRLQTAVWADTTAHHRKIGTWRDQVDLFAVPSRFARDKLLAAGLPAARVHVVPYPVVDPGASRVAGRGGVFVGRLSHEKGVDLLIDAWRGLPGVPLAIVGSGPEEARLRARAAALPEVCFRGEVGHEAAIAAMRAAAFVVVPSRWYEIYPLTVLGCGRPVIVANPTSLSEMVEPGHTGLWFERGEAASLAAACRALADDPGQTAAMGREAREVFEDVHGPAPSLARLEDMLASVLQR
jgi:glycosyltransferase involved in cell wall biosynthesis